MQYAMCPVRGERDADTQREGHVKTQGGNSVHRKESGTSGESSTDIHTPSGVK